MVGERLEKSKSTGKVGEKEEKGNIVVDRNEEDVEALISNSRMDGGAILFQVIDIFAGRSQTLLTFCVWLRNSVKEPWSQPRCF